MVKVLVTGAAGAVGRPVCRALLDAGHEVIALDRVVTVHATRHVVGNVADPHLMLEASQGVDAIVHLAAEPNDAPFAELLEPNVVGLYCAFNAARVNHVPRVVLASTIQVLGYRGQAKRPASVEDCSPSNHYALTKVWAETMGEMYSRQYGITVLSCRIAWMVRNPQEARRMEELGRFELYLSAMDAGRFFLRAVELPLSGFSVAYVVSRGGKLAFDMEPAKRLLGFEPEDNWPTGLGFEWNANSAGP